MKPSHKQLVALSGIAALLFAGLCAFALADSPSDAASRLGGLALPGAAAKTSDDASATEAPADEAPASESSDAASRLGGLAKPAAVSDEAEGASPAPSLGGLAAPSKGGGLAAPSKGSGLAAPSASGAAASDVWSPADGDWTYDLDCAACHEKESTSFDNDKCLALKHATLECMFCHSDEKGLVGSHGAIDAKTSAPSTLVKTKIDVEVTCQACHDPAKLVEATEASVVLTDDNGTVVNPHAIPDNAKHADTTCISCHKVHSTTALEKTAQRYCKGCHHAGVYECGTCHAV